MTSLKFRVHGGWVQLVVIATSFPSKVASFLILVGSPVKWK